MSRNEGAILDKFLSKPRRAIGYAGGGLLIFLSMGLVLESNLRAAVLFFAAGVLISPIVRDAIEDRFGGWIGHWVVGLLVLFLVILGFSSLETGVGTDPAEEIEKPAGELVFKRSQLGEGWSESARTDGQMRSSVTFVNSADDAELRGNVTKYDTIREADAAFDNRVEQITEENTVEEVSIGHEAALYTPIGIGNEARVLFRDSNVIGEVVYIERFSFDQKRRVKHFAEVMHRNFRT